VITSVNRRWWLAGIVALGLALRLAVSDVFDPAPPLFSDAEYYDAVARSLSGGDGHSVLVTEDAFLPGGPPTAFFPPGYSFFLALPYALFGPNLEVAHLANIAAGVVTVLLVYLIGARLLGWRAGLLGAFIAAIFPSLVFWTPVLLSETVFTCMFAAALLACVCSLTDDTSISWRMAALTGVLTGAAVLVRGPALVLLPVAILWWYLISRRPREALIGGGAAILGAAVVLTPWMMRNIIVFDSPVLLSTNFGYNLRVGHASYSTGRFIHPADIYEFVDEGEELELVLNEEGTRLALDYVVANPGREAELAVLKSRWLWSPDTDVVLWLSSFGRTPISSSTEAVVQWLTRVAHWLMLAMLVPAGAKLGRQHPAIVLTALVALAWTAVHIAFFGEPRYHLPLLPLLLPLAAVGGLSMARWIFVRLGARPTMVPIAD
jgi:4-amino-4-deoxy-L-arabinose transferase-like glycosyltransferase